MLYDQSHQFDIYIAARRFGLILREVARLVGFELFTLLVLIFLALDGV
ncbi:MAG: hypothetical protein ACI9ES_000793 [Oceanospirillaceae bacterium]